MGCDPMLARKAQISGREQTECNVEETLNANDAKTRFFVGALPEYNAPREQRDIARKTLTPLGSLESTKALTISFRAEVNTPDTFVTVGPTAAMDLDTIDYVSAPTAGGSIQRYTFNGTPDLSNVIVGQYLTSRYCTNATNDGDFKITLVNDGSDYVEVFNPNRTNATDDEATDSPGVCDIQNNLEYGWAIRGCAAIIKGLTRLAIGAVTSGPYIHGETVTGGTSSGTARVVIPAKDTDTHIYLEPLTGKLETGEVLTGADSGTTSTTSSGPSIYGYHVQPISENQRSITVSHKVDGFEYRAKNAMGSITGEFSANMAGFLDFAFQGPRSYIGDSALDTVVRDQEDPPILKNADLILRGTSDSVDFKPVVSKVGFDQGNAVSLRVNGNATGDSGIEGARVTARDGKITLSCEHELTTVFDYFQKLDDGEKVSLSYHLGQSSTKQFWFLANELEFEALPPSENNGIVTLDIEAALTGNAAKEDDEWEMVFLGN